MIYTGNITAEASSFHHSPLTFVPPFNLLGYFCLNTRPTRSNSLTVLQTRASPELPVPLPHEGKAPSPRNSEQRLADGAR